MPSLEAYFPGGLTDDRLLGGRVRLLQPVGGYRVAVDPVLLAAAVPAKPGEVIADFGAGTGAVGLCLAARVRGCRIVAIELESDLAALVRANAAANALDDAFQVVTADLANAPLPPASVDHVAMNPPYLADGAATRPPERLRRVAAVEGSLRLDGWITQAYAAVRAKGTISLVHRADRLDDIVAACRRLQTGGLAILPIWPKPDKPAHRVIVRLRKGDRSPLCLHPGLTLHCPDGTLSPAANAILRDLAALQD